MNDVEIARLNEENQRLRNRLNRLADEKSNLQLIIRLIEQLNPLPGIDDMLRTMLYSIMETIGGTNTKLYYYIDRELHYIDFLGDSRILPEIDDPLVAKVAAGLTFIEERQADVASLLQDTALEAAWTWVFPLLVGSELIGVIKLENLHISSASLRAFLPIFFSHAALILGNAIRNAQHLKAKEALMVSEQKLRTILDNVDAYIYLKDKQGRYTFANKLCLELWELPFEEVIGRTDDCFFTPEMAAAIHEHDLIVLNGETVKGEETGSTSKTGKLATYWVVKIPLRRPDGCIHELCGISVDITERKRDEDKLRHYKDQLEKEVLQRTAELILARDAAEAANRAKSVFLANMSHELRTPLNAILGFSNMMRKDSVLDQKAHENLDIINRSGEHLLTLINDVLEMSKIEAGRVQLDLAAFDLGNMVRDVMEMMLVRARDKGLQLVVDQASEFPRFIRGDEVRLRQVLINLIGNAIKFTAQGGVTIRLGTRAIPQQHLLIEVEDSGLGIASEDRQHLFQPFVQLAKHSGENKGTGLGLAISLQYVQLMGGTITVESALGKGSLFRVEIPLEPVTAGEVVLPQPISQGEVVGIVPGQPSFRILIVEDQLENQLLLAQLMERIGLNFKVAENGEQGVQIFRSWHPHLIWMDRRMPIMDGVEAARTIRGLPDGQQVKIVAVTASAFIEQREEMLAAGMDDFVRKPYRFQEIYACLTKQLGIRYLYASDTAALSLDTSLIPAMFTSVSCELRNELRTALEGLHAERIEAVIKKIESCDVNLSQILSQLAGNFDYPAILQALQATSETDSP